MELSIITATILALPNFFQSLATGSSAAGIAASASGSSNIAANTRRSWQSSRFLGRSSMTGKRCKDSNDPNEYPLYVLGDTGSQTVILRTFDFRLESVERRLSSER